LAGDSFLNKSVLENYIAGGRARAGIKRHRGSWGAEDLCRQGSHLSALDFRQTPWVRVFCAAFAAPAATVPGN